MKEYRIRKGFTFYLGSYHHAGGEVLELEDNQIAGQEYKLEDLEVYKAERRKAAKQKETKDSSKEAKEEKKEASKEEKVKVEKPAQDKRRRTSRKGKEKK